MDVSSVFIRAHLWFHFRCPNVVWSDLALLCASALERRNDPNALFVNYNQLPQFATSTLVRHFQLDYTGAEFELMNAAACFDAKNPALNFAPDSTDKQCAADENLRRLAGNLLMPLYAQLEAVRYDCAAG